MPPELLAMILQRLLFARGERDERPAAEEDLEARRQAQADSLFMQRLDELRSANPSLVPSRGQVDVTPRGRVEGGSQRGSARLSADARANFPRPEATDSLLTQLFELANTRQFENEMMERSRARQTVPTEGRMDLVLSLLSEFLSGQRPTVGR